MYDKSLTAASDGVLLPQVSGKSQNSLQTSSLDPTLLKKKKTCFQSRFELMIETVAAFCLA